MKVRGAVLGIYLIGVLVTIVTSVQVYTITRTIDKGNFYAFYLIWGVVMAFAGIALAICVYDDGKALEKLEENHRGETEFL